jgi:hypothetical protein
VGRNRGGDCRNLVLVLHGQCRDFYSRIILCGENCHLCRDFFNGDFLLWGELHRDFWRIITGQFYLIFLESVFISLCSCCYSLSLLEHSLVIIQTHFGLYYNPVMHNYNPKAFSNWTYLVPGLNIV